MSTDIIDRFCVKLLTTFGEVIYFCCALLCLVQTMLSSCSSVCHNPVL